MSAAIGAGKAEFSLKHSAKWTPDRAEEAKTALGIAMEQIQALNAAATKLADVNIDHSDWLDFMSKLMGADSVIDPKSAELTRVAQDIQDATLMSPGASLTSAKGTLWGAVNGITYYTDHMRGRTQDNRLVSAWFGDSDLLKRRAMSTALEMAAIALAKVSGSAVVSDYAEVSDSAKVSGSAKVYGYAKVSGHAEVSGEAVVSDSALVYGYAEVSDSAVVRGYAEVSGHAKVSGEAVVSDSAVVTDNAEVSGHAKVSGSAVPSARNIGFDRRWHRDSCYSARLVKADNEANRVLLALTANTGKPLTKWEVGRAYKRLEGYGWSYEAIGNKVGQSARYVRESIELSESPHDVQEMLSVGIITPRVALNAVRATEVPLPVYSKIKLRKPWPTVKQSSKPRASPKNKSL
ncbi:unnamed protein product [Sphagnum jensenii]|uniref:Uncharacterized protein n=1 Tax=Sphagnum jensenii TaxID=128206 RepID=A0ABP0VAQ7_9BRYO